jgi:hypothetical protein
LKLRSTSAVKRGLSLLLLCVCASAAGQLVSVDAGRGMEGEPSGGIVGVDFGKWSMEGSLGVFNGSIVGGADVKAQLNPKWSAKLGDQSIGVEIPTQTDFSAEVLARGLSVSYAPDAATQITFFGGMGGTGYLSTEVLFFDPQIALGAVSIDHYFDSKRRFMLFGRALFSNRQTALGGLLYKTKRLQTGFAAGIGSNQPHGEGLFDYKDKKWDIRSGYLYSGSKFELLTLPQFRYAQEDRGNVDAEWTPGKVAHFTVARHEYLEPPPVGAVNENATRGTMDTAGGTLSVHGVSVGANAFESRFTGIYTSAASYLASLRLNKRLQVSGNYYRPLHSTEPMPILTVNAEEDLNRRVKLTQVATHANGVWTVNYGGGLNWDRFDVTVGYSTDFAPLAAGGGRFKQETNVSAHLHLGRWQFGVQTYVQPDGSTLYSYEVKSFYFHPTADGSVQAPQARGMGLARFLIAGQVTMETTGKPLADVPVLIGSETVFTNESGMFSFRATHRRSYKIRLLLERPVDFHYYEPVSGPAEVMAGTDDAPGQAQFVVRVNQEKVPKLPKGGVVIGAEDGASDGTNSGEFIGSVAARQR